MNSESKALAKEVIFRNNGQLKLFCAESCTSGLLSGTIGSIPGASSLLWGGAVVYSYEAKTELTGVNPDLLIKDGAVSESVVEGMLMGILKNYPVSLAIAISGIAGPDGGTEDKPIGLVYIGIVHPVGETWHWNIKKFNFSGDRETIQGDTVKNALLLIKDAVEKSLESNT